DPVRHRARGEPREAIGDNLDAHGPQIARGDGTQPTAIGFTQVVTSTRNGNLQIAQLYSGAAQPSQAAADKAGGFYYGMSRDNGFPVSARDIIQSGNLNGRTFTADPLTSVIQDPTGTGVQTDALGSGT